MKRFAALALTVIASGEAGIVWDSVKCIMHRRTCNYSDRSSGAMKLCKWKMPIPYSATVRTTIPGDHSSSRQQAEDYRQREDCGLYAEKYGLHFKPEDINSDSCRSERKRLIEFCRACAIRQGGTARDVENCVHCPDQPYEALLKFHAYSAKAKVCFDPLKNIHE